MPPPTYRFPKQAKLTLRKAMDALFRQGKRWHGQHLTLYYLPQGKASPPMHQVLVSVPKKKVRKAVDRNKVKRRLREAYRLHAHLLQGLDTTLHLGYICTRRSTTLPTYAHLVQDVVASLRFVRRQHAPTMPAA